MFGMPRFRLECMLRSRDSVASRVKCGPHGGMKPHKLRFGLELELLTWFLSTRLLHQFLLTSLLTLFPKEHFAGSAHKLDRLLEIICVCRKHGWSWGCV
jgi:hypothetical protein